MKTIVGIFVLVISIVIIDLVAFWMQKEFHIHEEISLLNLIIIYILQDRLKKDDLI